MNCHHVPYYIAIILLGLSMLCMGCTAPLKITGVAMQNDGCGCTCVNWTTNIPAKSFLVYCKDGICCVGYQDNEYDYQHGDGVPADFEHITIKAESADGQTVYLEVR